MTGLYKTLLENMQAEYRSYTGVEPDDASDIGIRLKLVAGELEKLYEQIEYYAAQMFPQDSQGEFLDKHGLERGIFRKAPTAAGGILRFSRENPTNSDLTVPKGTLVSTQENPAVYYSTSEAAVLAAGNTFVDVWATATEAGSAGNVAAGKITQIVTAPIGITRVVNTAPFTGGENGETDTALRERITSSYRGFASPVNAAYYQNAALENPLTQSVKVVPKKRGRGTVDVVVTGKTPQGEIKLVKELSEKFGIEREICVDVSVKGAEKSFYVFRIGLQVYDNYSFPQVAKSCSAAVKAYVDSLGVGEPLRLSHLGRVILEVDGVVDYKIEEPVGDIVPDSGQKLYAYSVEVKAVGA